jgi:hypothetical protein
VLHVSLSHFHNYIEVSLKNDDLELYGYENQKFSGGATTKQIWGGSEFGSNTFKQFPIWSGRQGRGSRGYFIYPTLRKEQPYIVAEWTGAFNKILKEWG